MTKKITRRDALKNLGVAAGAAAIAPRMLSGCGGGGGGPEGITTIVTLMMENRSYDHFLGSRKMLEGKGGDGLVMGMSNPDIAGTPQMIHHADVACVADPPHDWDSCRMQLDAGACDGFMKSYQMQQGDTIPPHVMGYFTRDDLPVTYTLADAYTTCDRWFSSLLGPTWPNRMYLHTAQSNGHQDNKFPSDPMGFTWPTIYDSLNAKQVPWTYYYSDLPFLALWPNLGNANFKRVNYDFFDDCTNGKLPPVVFIDPAFSGNDDHPPHHPAFGQQLIGSIYQALATSPQWKNILFVVTYDEHGGFFDHVAPGTAPDAMASAGFNQLGFRVPAMIMGPYAKQGYVSSTPYDHTSVLKHIEGMFGLDPLTMRDAAANDLMDAIDMDRLMKNKPADPITLPMIMGPDPVPAECTAAMMKSTGNAPKLTEIEMLADAGFFPKHLDLRREVPDLLRVIDEYYRRHAR
jgi:phospholipase C